MNLLTFDDTRSGILAMIEYTWVVFLRSMVDNSYVTS